MRKVIGYICNEYKSGCSESHGYGDLVQKKKEIVFFFTLFYTNVKSSTMNYFIHIYSI